MKPRGFWVNSIRSGIVLAGLVSTGAIAQTKPGAVPDAQIEANVLKALAGSPQLANQSITSTTVYGVVTLSGNVSGEASRDLAEKIVSTTAGVQKVVDQLVVGGQPASTGQTQSPAQSSDPGSNPNMVLQSDGTYAPADSQAQPDAGAAAVAAAPPTASAPAPAPVPNTPNYPQQAGQYPPQAGQYPQQAGQYPPPPQSQYPPTYRQPYAPYYGQPQRPPQRGGDAVVIPAGTVLQARINQAMDSKNTAPGTAFNGVMLADVWAGNSIAIPRGSVINGVVVDSHPAGTLKGKGELKLQLTQVSFGGRIYPISTDFWWHQGVDKTGSTVGNTVGLGAMGALIGAVAGGGVGAAVGAGIGGVAGLGVSSASGRGEASIPAEAIISFHLTQPADVTTVSQAELDRLGAGLPPGAPPRMVRRYPPPPPPPPYYYGPNY